MYLLQGPEQRNITAPHPRRVRSADRQSLKRRISSIMEQKSKKSTLLGWGVGDFGFQLMIYVSVSYFSAFLTDYAELPLALAGVVMTITGIGDAITQPFSGVLVTKMNMRWGKYRSWYIVGPPIVLAAFVMTFTKIGSPVMAAAIIFVFYVISRFTFNCIWAAHLALIPYVGKNPQERSFLSASRGIWQTAGTLLFSAIGLSILNLFTGKLGNVNGFTLFAFVFGLCMWAGYTVSFIATRGTPEPTKATEAKKKQKVGAKSFIMAIVKNPPLLFLMLAEVARNLSQFLFTIFIFYYFKYTTDVFLMYSVFMTVTNVVKLVGAGLTTWICGKIGAKNTYLFGTIGNAVFFAVAFLFANNVWLFMVFCSLAFLAVSLPVGATSLMFGQCGEYSQWKTGVDNRAFVTGLIGFPVKIASFTKGPLMSAALIAMGFVANTDASPAVISGLRFQSAMVPAIWSVISAVFILFYGLNNKKVKEMEAGLKAMEAAAE